MPARMVIFSCDLVFLMCEANYTIIDVESPKSCDRMALPMKAALQRLILVRLRAAIALVMLAAGWASAPLVLAFEPSNACSMDCCITEGHCCCNPPKPSVEGQPPDGNDHIDNVQIAADCPQGCTTPQSSSKIRERDSNRAVIQLIAFSSPVAIRPNETISKPDPQWSRPSSPRAPPSSLSI